MSQNPEILNYVRGRYVEEKERFNHFEDKCGKILNSLTIVIVAFCGIVGFKSDKLFSPTTILEWTNLFLCFLAFSTLSCAWCHSLLALKIGKSPIAAKDKENADYLLNSEPQDAFEQMFACYVDATQELEAVIEDKSKNLEHAYSELFIGAGWVIGFILLTITMEVFL